MAKDKKPRLTKEGLDAQFTEQQAKNRARRANKVTPEDVERTLAERKAKKAERRVPGQRARTVSLGIGIALLVGTGAVTMGSAAGTNTFEHATVVNDVRIGEMKAGLRAIPASDEAAVAEYGAELDKQIETATQKAEEVAALQQGFGTILFEGDTTGSGDGVSSAAYRDSAEHRRLLAPYFVERALFVEDALAYAAGSVLPFDADEIDPRFPWYVGYVPGSNGRTVVDPGTSSWELVSVVATETDGILDVTWLNQSAATGDLYAWATASYYTDPSAFGSLMVGKTTLGERFSASASARTAGEDGA